MKHFRKQLLVFGLVILTCMGMTFSFQVPVYAGEILEQPINSVQVSDPQSIPSKESCIPIGEKIDLNNANALAFKDCPGYYPTLAKKIINNGPFETVDEVLNIRGLNLKQKQLLEDKLDFFTVSEPKTDLATRMPPRPMMR
ncbi:MULTISPECIES: photosystem II complex extrinsic protein PsbU [Acaryochloris]|uniref:Photosystem II 12 kDa extrinsic protein PsbU n=1 Tax=Acaryochloris marina (strain MBIC 11017) TaxID=329726 RepID=A8ZNP7_ACAM1|nr:MULTISPECIES: photosystem II complex extrinsic protein PsbU [Acaryochloris]ABW32633.1 photosystem II 12 kDa extrinsic protein PsbU [Acaryochloris marina MBIC11017]KAI9129650.1 photosystem II protein [Acaryochloris sp. CCMEE 5410]